ncbi:uncharacterized protein BXZ73DRAFT_42156 [Epithele typhae]|uniref:uncharacterized protein n=1 Tax=Epithele typhae TaxID=378194 RepID=UPI002007AD80|nr:uncharacterized protein BXZ73DRAFT_42156 [Epithele typhae]KAH9941136.1 hypothetical protein BXZ73DRAFT_42156 [Epithele typhae]
MHHKISPRDNLPGRKPFNPDRRCHWFDNSGRPFKRLDGGIGCPRDMMCFFAHPSDGDKWRDARSAGEPPLHYLTDDEYRLIVGRPRSPGRLPGYRPSHPYQPRRRSASIERNRRSAERRHDRTPPPGPRPRSNSRGHAPPTLASRIRRRSSSRGRDMRPPYRSSRSRSPPPRGGRPRSPPSGPGHRQNRSFGGYNDSSRNGPPGRGRSPVIFPKVEAVDVPMRDLLAPARPGREDSIASTQAPARPRILTAPASATSGFSSANQLNGNLATNALAGPSKTGNSNSDDILSLLESSTAQWQQISTAVAAATSAVPRSGMPSPLSGDLSADEAQKIWASRIELLAAAMVVHNECRAMKNDIQDYKKLAESFNYQRLDQEDRTVLGGHAQTLEQQLAKKSEDLRHILTQLAGARFWPTHTRKRAPTPDSDGARQQEFIGHLQSINASVTILQGLLRTADRRWETIAARLEDDHRTSDPSAFLAEAVVPAELAKIRDELAEVERRLGDLEAGAARHRDALADEVDAIVAENVQAVVLAATGSVEARPPVPRAVAALSEEQLRTLRTLQENAAATGQQVARLSNEVQALAGSNDVLRAENVQLQAECAQLKQQLQEVRRFMDAATSDSVKLDRMHAEMRALNVAVKAYAGQSSSGQQASQTADLVAKQVTQLLSKVIPQLIAPGLQNTQTQLLQALQAQQAEAMKEFTARITSTYAAVEHVQASMDRMQHHNVTGKSLSPVNGTSTNGQT